jgi:hypothetical protein
MAGGDANSALRDAAAKAFGAPFGAVLELRPEEGAGLWVDGRQEPPQILDAAPDGAEADCVWRGARETLQRALVNARAFDSAYLSGRLAIAGDMSVMARLETQDGR